jgi:hypothetical protein
MFRAAASLQTMYSSRICATIHLSSRALKSTPLSRIMPGTGAVPKTPTTNRGRHCRHAAEGRSKLFCWDMLRCLSYGQKLPKGSKRGQNFLCMSAGGVSLSIRTPKVFTTNW